MKKLSLITLGILLIGFSLNGQNRIPIDSIQSTILAGTPDTSHFMDSTVITSGIVTGIGKDTNAYFIQDGDSAWNGVYVYDWGSADTMSRGDSITLRAEVTEYNSITQLVNVDSSVLHSSGNPLPNPATISTNNVKQEMYEGVLVEVMNATCNADSNAYGQWPLNDGSGEVLADDLIYPYKPVVNAVYNVTGPVHYNQYSSSEYMIEPRDTNDITVVSMPSSSITPISTIQSSTMSGNNDTSTYIDSPAVNTTGIVTGTFYDSQNFNTGYFIQEDSGAWHGIFVYDTDSNRVASLNRGDSITLTANVAEYYSKTQLSNVSSLTINSTGNPEPSATVVPTDSINNERYEGVKVQVRNAECVRDSNQYRQWVVDDSSGWAVVNDLMYGYDPIVTATYHVRGPVDFSFDNFKIEPRDSNDITLVSKPKPITSIYDIQSTLGPSDSSAYRDSSAVRTTGIVTGTFYDSQNFNTGYFIQEDSGGWHGLFVYDWDSFRVTSLNRGDSIVVTGEVEEHYSQTQLANITSVNVISTGNPEPKATVLQTGDVGQEKYEGVKVKVENATCEQDTNFYNEWVINDGSGNVTVNDLMFVYDPVVGDDYHVTGVVDYSFSTFKIEPRNVFDIQHLTGIDELSSAELTVYPNPTPQQLHLQFKETQTQEADIKFYNSQGQLVRQLQTSRKQATLDVSDLNAGLYIMTVRTGEQLFRKKIMVAPR